MREFNTDSDKEINKIAEAFGVDPGELNREPEIDPLFTVDFGERDSETINLLLAEEIFRVPKPLPYRVNIYYKLGIYYPPSADIFAYTCLP